MPEPQAPADTPESLLWRRHLEHQDEDARAKLIESNMNLAKKIAASLFSKRYNDDVEFDEFYQLGIIGLIESVDRYSPEKGAAFETFATYRVRGSILNGLEKMSELRSQSAYRNRQRKDRISSIVSKEQSSGDQLFGDMVEVTLGLAIGFVLEDTDLARDFADNASDHAYDENHLSQLRALLINSIDRLPDRERKIIQYHYLQGMRFDVVADLMGVTKGRVSQMHKRGLQLLRKALGDDQSLDTYL